MNQKNFLFALLALLFAFSIFPIGVKAVYVSVPNGSFETGDNTDYNTISSSDVKINSYLITNGSANRTFTPVDGNFFYVYNWNKMGSYSRPVEQVKFCSVQKIINPNEVIDLNLYLKSAGWISTESNTVHDYVGNSSYIEFLYAYISPTPNISIYNLTTGAYTYSSSMRLTWGVSSNNYVTGTMTNGASASHLCFILGSNDVGGGSFAFTEHDYVMLDKIQIQVNPTLINTITTDALPRNFLESGYIYVTVADSLGNTWTGSDANVKVNFNSAGYQSATWDSSLGKYKYLVSGLGQGNYTYDVNTSKSSGYVSDLDTAKVWTVSTVPTALTVNCIQNCTASTSTTAINLSLASNADTIFSVQNSQTYSVTAPINFSNADKSQYQYFIYTSTNGSDWTFSDTLTFGSTNYNPVQKVWDSNAKTFDYNFSSSFTPSTINYFKLVFAPIPIAWETIKDSVDWANVNAPSTVTDNIESGGLHHWDLFQDSNYTSIQSFTLKPYPQLTSTALTAGFEVQFTAYASTATTLKVGYRVNSTDTTQDVSVTTIPTRVSVLVQPNDFDAILLIKSLGSVSSRVYISDYAIVPRTYFVDRLDLRTSQGNVLPSILRSGVTLQYVVEGLPFQAKTKAYNQNQELKTLITQVLFGSTVIKSYEFALNSQQENATLDLTKALEGVIDYNGYSVHADQNVFFALEDLRALTVKNILVNNLDQNVAEQSKTVYLLQFPYFPDDIALSVSSLSNKVGSNPKVNISIINKAPDTILGIKFFVYDSTHSKSNPSYSKIVYANDLGCNKQMVCQKQLVFDEWTYPDANNYTIGFSLILTTEPQNYLNPLTYKQINILTNYSSFETARILQVFERANHQYNNSEQIPLLLQVKEDSLRNLVNDYTVFMQIDINSEGNYSLVSNKFYPSKFIYDEVTGYNYWFWNQVFYDDSGNLIPDHNALRLRAFVLPMKAQNVPLSTGYGLIDKCLSYPVDIDYWNPASLVMNWIGMANDFVYGCQTLSPTVVAGDSVLANQIDINNSYSPAGLQNESVFCIRNGVNMQFKQDVGDSFVCGVLYLKSEQQIDGFKVFLGNSYSDYSKTGDEAQYISFDIPQEEVMFNDIFMVRSALQTEFSTQSIDTLGEVLAAGFNKILPYGQGLVDYVQLQAGNGVFLMNVGADINLSEQLNPNVVNGLFFFKVDGLKLTNQYDYVLDYPELETINPTLFRSFAISKNIFLPKKTTTISTLSRDFSQTNTIKLNSPLVIYEKPVASKTSDLNGAQSIMPTQLKFNFIVDMFSNNYSTGMRATVPIVFSYLVPPQKISLTSISNWIGALWDDPVGTVSNVVWDNALILAALLLVALIASVIHMNFKGGSGGTNLNFFNKAS